MYLVSVTASETSNTLKLEITVIDVDEARQGVARRSLSRRSAGGLIASLSDPDADVEAERWQWARGETADGPWTDIDRCDIGSPAVLLPMT